MKPRILLFSLILGLLTAAPPPKLSPGGLAKLAALLGGAGLGAAGGILGVFLGAVRSWPAPATKRNAAAFVST
jgi:hypothetical protein